MIEASARANMGHPNAQEINYRTFEMEYILMNHLEGIVQNKYHSHTQSVGGEVDRLRVRTRQSVGVSYL